VIIELGSPTVISTERLLEDTPATAVGGQLGRDQPRRAAQAGRGAGLGARPATLSSTAGAQYTSDPTIYCEARRPLHQHRHLPADHRHPDQGRGVVVLPLGGAPMTFDSW